MQKLRWPELDVVESTGKIVDEFYTQTNKGPLLTACLFPMERLAVLANLRDRIAAKQKELDVIEAEIYKVKR